MSASKRRRLDTQPGMLDFGSQYVGARITGSFQVLDATSCERFYDRA